MASHMCYIRHIQDSCIFSTLFFQVYACIVNHIQSYSGLFIHPEVLLKHIQDYAAKFRTLNNPRILSSLPYYERWHIQKQPEAYLKVDQEYPELCHRILFRTLCNSCKCRNLAYPESWSIQNSSIIASRYIFKTLSYL